MSDEFIAIGVSSFNRSGCIKCGCEYAYNNHGIMVLGTISLKCAECGAEFVVIADGMKESCVGFGNPPVYPKLHKHPRHLFLKHPYVIPDIPPETGGEYFSPRGLDYVLPGFVKCKKVGGGYFSPRGLDYVLPGFVKCKEAGERVVKMFNEIALERNNSNDAFCFVCGKNPAKLDYRKTEPDWVLVFVGYCPECSKNAKILYELTSDGIITKEKIIQAIDGIEPEKSKPIETDENTEVGSFVLTSVITVKMNL